MGNLLPYSNTTRYASESESSYEDSDSDSDYNFEDNSHLSSLQTLGTSNTFDATLRQSASLPNPNLHIGLEQIRRIQENLDDDEMISLIYLLFEQPHYALQELSLWKTDRRRQVLHDWANLQKKDTWHKELLEALCIIKNYYILKMLGYNKETLKIHFLPDSPYTSIHVNKMKKMLYIICEKLNSTKTQKVIDTFRHEFLQHNDYHQDSQFLEIHLLEWESLKLVTPANVRNLMTVFKVMDEEEIYNILEGYTNLRNVEEQDLHLTAHPSTVPGKPQKSSTEDRTSVSKVTSESPPPILNSSPADLASEEFSSSRRHYRRTTSTSVDNQQQHQSEISVGPVERPKEAYLTMPDDIWSPDECDNRFKIDPNNPGIVLIINQKNFYRSYIPKYEHLLPPENVNLEERIGTDKDKDKLISTFGKFGFKIITHDDLVHEKMLEEIKNVVSMVKDESSLFVCIMSHGDEGVVYGADSCRVSVSQIEDIICRCKNLVEKPKVLILQSCQGLVCQRLNDHGSDDENVSNTTDGGTRYPGTVNMLTFWATVPGYAAIRNKEKGSWFIQSLCDKMEMYADRLHFQDICTRIKQDVTERTWEKGTDQYKMVPVITRDTFRHSLYLPKIRLT